MITVTKNARPQPIAVIRSTFLSSGRRLAKSGIECMNSEVTSRIAAVTASQRLKSEMLKIKDMFAPLDEFEDGADAAVYR